MSPPAVSAVSILQGMAAVSVSPAASPMADQSRGGGGGAGANLGTTSPITTKDVSQEVCTGVNLARTREPARAAKKKPVLPQPQPTNHPPLPVNHNLAQNHGQMPPHIPPHFAYPQPPEGFQNQPPTYAQQVQQHASYAQHARQQQPSYPQPTSYPQHHNHHGPNNGYHHPQFHNQA